MRKLFRTSVVAVMAVCLLVSCVLPISAASTGTLGVKAESKSVKAGDTFDLNISLTANPGVTSLRLCVSYDPEVLTLVGAVDKQVLQGGLFSDDYTSPYKLYWVDAYSTVNNTSTGVVATLKFKANKTVTEVTTTDVTISLISENDALDCNMNKVAVTAVDSEVTVTPVIIGDLNDDKKVTAVDAIYLLYNTLGNQGYPLNQDCDFNRDGDVTSDDALYLLYNVHYGNTLYPLS